MARIRSERGLDRLVNFSDATVAIAITLLVLPLVDIAPEIEHRSLGEVLGDNLDTFLAFVISFVVIARLWMVHHRVFDLVVDYSYAIMWINMLWLASIIVLPFATNLVADSDDPNAGGGPGADVDALYVGTMLVASGAMVAMQVILVRRPALVRPEARGSIRMARAFVPLSILALALVLAALTPRIGLYWLGLLFFSSLLSRAIERRAATRATRAGTPGDER